MTTRSLEAAYKQINNLDVPEPLRRFAPVHSLTMLSREGEVVAVVKFKQLPTEEEQLEVLRSHPDCIQLPTRVGMHASTADFRKRVDKAMSLFARLR